jgi:hypothetical protein
MVVPQEELNKIKRISSAYLVADDNNNSLPIVR